jgi:hypothetical protein
MSASKHDQAMEDGIIALEMIRGMIFFVTPDGVETIKE